jgi:hypothetical protein
MCTDKLAYKSGMAGEFSGDSEWRVVVAGELLFVFGFIFASIMLAPWQYGLASQNSACQQVNACKQNMQR